MAVASSHRARCRYLRHESLHHKRRSEVPSKFQLQPEPSPPIKHPPLSTPYGSLHPPPPPPPRHLPLFFPPVPLLLISTDIRGRSLRNCPACLAFSILFFINKICSFGKTRSSLNFQFFLFQSALLLACSDLSRICSDLPSFTINHQASKIDLLFSRTPSADLLPRHLRWIFIIQHPKSPVSCQVFTRFYKPWRPWHLLSSPERSTTSLPRSS